jgi:translation initiation factor IF-3
MDYGRFKYSMERKQREAHRAGKAGRAASEMKDVQLSPRIDEHDMLFKVDRAQQFLAEGHPVRLVVRFLGRDMRHPEVGMSTLQEALKVLGERVAITVDQQPRMEGRQLFALIRLAKGARAGEKKAPREPGAAPAASADAESVVTPDTAAAVVAPSNGTAVADGAVAASTEAAEPVPAGT